MYDIVNDISTLTNVSKVTIDTLFDKMILCICHNLYEGMCVNGADAVESDIGIGILYVRKVGDELKFRFEPSAKLSTAVKDVMFMGIDPLTSSVEITLKERLENTYKDLL